MTEQVKAKRKTVKQVDAEQDTTEQALIELAEMVVFLNQNPNYWATDYISRPEFKGTALDKLISKGAE